MTSHVVFLGFVVSSKGVEYDTKKVKTILEWPKPANLLEARSFHGLENFYKRFIRHFSTIMAPITNCLKRGQFEVTTDASNMGIGGILSQKGHPVAYFNKKLNNAKLKYSTYDEFYAIMQALHYWHNYLIYKEFVLFSDHESLKYINSQKKLNYRHGNSVSFLQEYTFVLKHKARVENRATNVLSRVIYILTSLAVQVIGFDQLIKDYSSYKDFSIIYSELLNGQRAHYLDFSIHDGYLFKGTCLCMLNSSLKEQAV